MSTKHERSASGSSIAAAAGSGGSIHRRKFLKLAATAAAGTGLGGSVTLSRPPFAMARQPDLQMAQSLGNAEPPAMQFQAYPGGTGALLEKLWSESGGTPFQCLPLEIEPWQGAYPATEEDLAFLPVHRQAALIREGAISPTELTEIYLTRLKRHDPVLLCAVRILEGQAREEAQQAEADLRSGRYRGPLHGIPYGLKDLFSTRGVPTSWGARHFENQLIDEDAEVVVRLREAGAVLMAKLSTGLFARGDNWFRGRTRNPWNTEQGSSGSSAGPASATAAGCVSFAIGTETQGSLASPARRCGICTLRPTFGRISRHGGMVLAWSMDKVGPMCRTVEDCALVFAAIHGSDRKDPSTLTAPFRFRRDMDLSTVRIGFSENAPEAFLAKLRELGADPQPMPPLPSGQSNALTVESAAAFDFYITAGDDEEHEVREGEDRGNRFRNGRSTSALDYMQSQRRRALFMEEMAQAMKDFDMYVSASGDVRLTNQTGHPAVILPCDFGGRNPQPICTTIVGQLFADDLILSVAHAYQSGTDWHMRRPDLS